MTADPTDGVDLPPASDRQGESGHDMALDRANAIRILTLRTARMTYDQIAVELGYGDGSAARRALIRALDRHEAENVTQLRTLENLALDADERTLTAIASDTTKTDATRIRAVDAKTRLRARRARMNGLDAPVQVQISAGIAAELQAAMDELEAAYGAGETVPGEVLARTDELMEG